MRDFRFLSKLAPLMQEYLEQRHKNGYQIRSYEYYIKEFDRLCYSEYDEPLVIKEAVDAWDKLKPYLSNRTKIARHNTIRSFAIFVFARNSPSYVPDTSKLKDASPFTPYIFTKKEVQKLLHAADNLPIRSNAPTRHLVIPAAFRMLYGCGFRVNEIFCMKLQDIDWDNGIATVKNGKGGKDRYVPLHSDLTRYMKGYCSQLPKKKSDDWLFPSSYGHYVIGTVYQNFRELLFLCGIPHGGKSKGPRVHDFRHTFAVHSLEAQLAQGYDPMVILPRLATYLGHKTYRDTCWYLHLTEAAFPDLTGKFEACYAAMIPSIGGELFEEY